jgi:hypothetical protein
LSAEVHFASSSSIAALGIGEHVSTGTRSLLNTYELSMQVGTCRAVHV